jgi:hypothetical protein
MTVDNVAWISAERHEVGRVKLKRGLKVERMNVMHLEGVSLSTRFASRVSLEVCGTNTGPLRRSRHASGDEAGIGFLEQAEHSYLSIRGAAAQNVASSISLTAPAAIAPAIIDGTGSHDSHSRVRAITALPLASCHWSAAGGTQVSVCGVG